MNATPDPNLSTGHRDGAWTEDRIRALGAVTDLPTAARIFGLGRSLAYDLARTDRFPAPVIRAGTRYRVPIAGILAALGLPATRDLTFPAESSVDHHGAIRTTVVHDHATQGEP